MYFYCYVYVSLFMFIYLHRARWHSSATLTEVFRAFSSVVRQTTGKTRKDGAQTALFQTNSVVLCFVCFVSFCVLCWRKCLLYESHRVATQMQLANVSYQSTEGNSFTLLSRGCLSVCLSLSLSLGRDFHEARACSWTFCAEVLC